MRTQKEIEKIFSDMGLGSEDARKKYAFSYSYENEHVDKFQTITKIDTKTRPLEELKDAELESDS